MLRLVVLYKLTDVSEVLNAMVFMMEAVSTSETSDSLYQTFRRNVPEDIHLRSRRRLKCHLKLGIFVSQSLV
jgi:hypothetical protein